MYAMIQVRRKFKMHSYVGSYWITLYALLGDMRRERKYPPITPQEIHHQEVQKLIGIKNFGGMNAEGIECQDGSWLPWETYYTEYDMYQNQLLNQKNKTKLIIFVGFLFILLGFMVCLTL